MLMRKNCSDYNAINEVLIKIYATSGHIGDSRMRRFDIPGGFLIQILARLMLGISRPSRMAKKSILGMDIAGEIAAVGKTVTKFKKGDQVFASQQFLHGSS